MMVPYTPGSQLMRNFREEDMLDDEISKDDLSMLYYPSDEVIEANGTAQDGNIGDGVIGVTGNKVLVVIVFDILFPCTVFIIQISLPSSFILSGQIHLGLLSPFHVEG